MKCDHKHGEQDVIDSRYLSMMKIKRGHRIYLEYSIVNDPTWIHLRSAIQFILMRSQTDLGSHSTIVPIVTVCVYFMEKY